MTAGRLSRTAELVALASVAALAALSIPPPASIAEQPPKVFAVGLLRVGAERVPPSLEGLREGLKALGYEEGRNVRLDWRTPADEEAGRAAVADFVRDRVDVIVAFENAAVQLARAGTSEIPVIFLHAVDPRRSGFVSDLSHPDVTAQRESAAARGGNLTGFAGPEWEPPARQVRTFRELVPKLRRLLVLTDPGDPPAPEAFAEMRRMGSTLKIEIVERPVRDRKDIEGVLARVSPKSVDGVLVASPRLQERFAAPLLRQAAERRLPVCGSRREMVEQGALFFYGADSRSVGRAAARYVDKILRGVPVGALPVEFPQPELVVNLKTARALGLSIPSAVLLRASQVIK